MKIETITHGRRLHWTVRETLITTGAVGASLGLFLRAPGPTFLGGLLFGLFWAVGKLGLFKIPLKIRLGIEVLFLVGLFHLSSIIWAPRTYIHQARRCETLASEARARVSGKPDVRRGLDREAAWFSRKAAELRRNAWWIGLTQGPAAFNDSADDLVYELGTSESIEKHEKRLLVWLASP